MSKWACSIDPELIPVPKDETHFDQILAEISSVLYGSYCQLYQNQPQPSPKETQDSLLTDHSMVKKE